MFGVWSKDCIKKMGTALLKSAIGLWTLEE